MFFAAVMMVMAVVMASCGGSVATPSGVVDEAVACIENGDWNKYLDLVDFGEDAPTAEEKAQVVALLEQKASASVEKTGKIVSHEIVSEEISEDGKEATVTVKVNYEKESEESKVKCVKLEDGTWKLSKDK